MLATVASSQALPARRPLRLDSAAPPKVRAAFMALARFAEFSDTGAQTTYSFGLAAVSFLPPA